MCQHDCYANHHCHHREQRTSRSAGTQSYIYFSFNLKLRAFLGTQRPYDSVARTGI